MPKSYAVIYILGGLICVVIIAMSMILLLKAARRAKAIGMDKKIITDTVKSSAIFSIVPSIPIVIGVGIMMQYLGLAIPWIRLTVIGALQYEIIAMDQVFNGQTVSESLIAAAIVIMTISIMSGPIFNALFYKKYQNKLMSLQSKNEKLMNTITGALLAGLLAGILSAMLVTGFFTIGEPVSNTATGVVTYGEITLITLFASVVIMCLCGLILIKFKQKWIESYALPITILGALAIAYAFIPVFA